jgi:hypothetical protein
MLILTTSTVSFVERHFAALSTYNLKHQGLHHQNAGRHVVEREHQVPPDD